MKKVELFIKRILLASIVGMLALSFLQTKYKFIQLSVLEGYIEYASKPYLSAKTWLDGSYQKQSEKYINQNIGFRPVFVRLRNQLLYSFFNETTAQEIVIGKEQYLYENSYINAYLGRDYMGNDSIDQQVFRLRKLQDTLNSMNIHLAVILAAGKASFFPDYIPDRFNPTHKTISNYESYQHKLNVAGIQHIDFNRWFLEMKEQSAHPLYPKFGIHWSKYGESLVADSIINYIEHHKKITLHHLKQDTIELSDTARSTDYDIAGAMNLLYKLPGYPLAYPSLRTVEDSLAVKPAVTVIGDSYYSSLSSILSKSIFSPGQFWYYNERIYSSDVKSALTVAQIDSKSEIEKQDVVFILSTEANLNRLGFGFIEMMYDAYFNPEKYYNRFLKRKERIDYWKDKIRSNNEWLKSIEEKAFDRKMDIEEMIQLDAEYMVNQEES